jgi:hypothetical protein
MADQGMDADSLHNNWNMLVQIVENGGEGGCFDFVGVLSSLIRLLGDDFHEAVYNFRGLDNSYAPGQFGQNYVNFFISRYPDNPAIRIFLQDLAHRLGHDNIDTFFGNNPCRAQMLGLGNDKLYKGAGDIGKRIREVVRVRSKPAAQPATPSRRGAGGGGGEGETEE